MMKESLSLLIDVVVISVILKVAPQLDAAQRESIICAACVLIMINQHRR